MLRRTLLLGPGLAAVLATPFLYSLKDHNNQINKGLQLASNLIAFDTTHIAFTFILLIFHQSFREWFHKSGIYSPRNPWFFGLVLFSLASILHLFSLKTGLHTLDRLSSEFINFFWILAPAFHAYAQSIGLFLGIYHDHNQSSYPGIRSGLYTTLYLSMTLIVLNFYPPLTDLLSQAHLQWINTAGLSVWTLFYLNTVRLSWNAINSKEAITFLLRLVVWPMTLIAGPMSILAGMIHGSEYLYFFLKLDKPFYKNNKAAVRLSLGIFAVIFGLAANGTFNNLILSMKNQRDWAFAVPQTVFWILIASHYLLDRQMFGMRYPLSRKFIGPILNGIKVR